MLVAAMAGSVAAKAGWAAEAVPAAMAVAVGER